MTLEEAAAEFDGQVLYRQVSHPKSPEHGWIVVIDGKYVQVRMPDAGIALCRPEDLELIAHAPAPTSTFAGGPSAWTPESAAAARRYRPEDDGEDAQYFARASEGNDDGRGSELW